MMNIHYSRIKKNLI